MPVVIFDLCRCDYSSLNNNRVYINANEQPYQPSKWVPSFPSLPFSMCFRSLKCKINYIFNVTHLCTYRYIIMGHTWRKDCVGPVVSPYFQVGLAIVYTLNLLFKLIVIFFVALWQELKMYQCLKIDSSKPKNSDKQIQVPNIGSEQESRDKI